MLVFPVLARNSRNATFARISDFPRAVSTIIDRATGTAAAEGAAEQTDGRGKTRREKRADEQYRNEESRFARDPLPESRKRISFDYGKIVVRKVEPSTASVLIKVG